MCSWLRWETPPRCTPSSHVGCWAAWSPRHRRPWQPRQQWLQLVHPDPPALAQVLGSLKMMLGAMQCSASTRSLSRTVVHRQSVPSFGQVHGHVLAHVAQTNEANLQNQSMLRYYYGCFETGHTLAATAGVMEMKRRPPSAARPVWQALHAARPNMMNVDNGCGSDVSNSLIFGFNEVQGQFCCRIRLSDCAQCCMLPAAWQGMGPN